MARADGSLRGLLARLGRIDVLVIDDWAMAPPLGTRAPRLLGDLRRPLRGTFYDPDFATAGVTLARADWRSYTGRWDPRPVGSQCAPDRDARRLYAQKSAKGELARMNNRTWDRSTLRDFTGVSVPGAICQDQAGAGPSRLVALGPRLPEEPAWCSAGSANEVLRSQHQSSRQP